MKITFLGTSHGRPEADRYCSSTMLETERGDIYLVDAGAPVIDQFYRLGKNVEKLKGVFITHIHCDHLDGIFSLLTHIATRWQNLELTIVIPSVEVVTHIKRYVEIVAKKPVPSP